MLEAEISSQHIQSSQIPHPTLNHFDSAAKQAPVCSSQLVLGKRSPTKISTAHPNHGAEAQEVHKLVCRMRRCRNWTAGRQITGK